MLRRGCGALRLSPTIEKRSEPFETFGKLDVRLFSNEDIILFKGITEREDDEADMAAIIKQADPIDWNAILEECKSQSEGSRAWFGALHNDLNGLVNRGIQVPILDELYALDEHVLLQEHYDFKRNEGVPEKEILRELRKEGATPSELKKLQKK